MSDMIQSHRQAGAGAAARLAAAVALAAAVVLLSAGAGAANPRNMGGGGMAPGAPSDGGWGGGGIDVGPLIDALVAPPPPPRRPVRVYREYAPIDAPPPVRLEFRGRCGPWARAAADARRRGDAHKAMFARNKYRQCIEAD